MSTKEERPTLAGVNVKTRKRNIVVPADPASFATAIVQIFQVPKAAVAAVSVQLQHAGHEGSRCSCRGG
jgi:hypothetical protein